jgi:hypothetical protein
LELQDDIDFNTGKLMSFASGQQHVTPSIDSLQIDQKVRMSSIKCFVFFVLCDMLDLNSSK